MSFWEHIKPTFGHVFVWRFLRLSKSYRQAVNQFVEGAREANDEDSLRLFAVLSQEQGVYGITAPPQAPSRFLVDARSPHMTRFLETFGDVVSFPVPYDIHHPSSSAMRDLWRFDPRARKTNQSVILKLFVSFEKESPFIFIDRMIIASPLHIPAGSLYERGAINSLSRAIKQFDTMITDKYFATYELHLDGFGLKRIGSKLWPEGLESIQVDVRQRIARQTSSQRAGEAKSEREHVREIQTQEARTRLERMDRVLRIFYRPDSES